MPKKIYLCGDYVIDHLISDESKRHLSSDKAIHLEQAIDVEDGTMSDSVGPPVSVHKGGAWILNRFLRALPDIEGTTIKLIEERDDSENDTPPSDAEHLLHMLWAIKKCPRYPEVAALGNESENFKNEKDVYRVVDTLTRSDANDGKISALYKDENCPEEADLTVISEYGVAVRQSHCWEEPGRRKALIYTEQKDELRGIKTVVVVSRDLPRFDDEGVATSPLWKTILSEQNSLRENTLIVTSLDQFRMRGLDVPKQRSWDSLIDEFSREYLSCNVINSLSQAGHLVIRIGVTGAIYCYKDYYDFRILSKNELGDLVSTVVVVRDLPEKNIIAFDENGRKHEIANSGESDLKGIDFSGDIQDDTCFKIIDIVARVTHLCTGPEPVASDSTEGEVYIRNAFVERKFDLLYDPMPRTKHMWYRDVDRQGNIFASRSAYAASFVESIISNSEDSDDSDRELVRSGIRKAISRIQYLYDAGFGEKPEEWLNATSASAWKEVLDLESKENTFIHTVTPPTDESVYEWGIIRDSLREGQKHNFANSKEESEIYSESEKNRLELAINIAKYGIRSVMNQENSRLWECGPVASFGKMAVLGKKDVENFNSVRTLLRDYINRTPTSRPLGLAVFGQPGGGKSFGIKEIAREVAGDKVRISEYNLSQMKIDSPDLADAFLNVSDSLAQGKIPLVFFDEFDSDDLKWVRYFLSPLQDGIYSHSGRSLEIKKAIFIFVGGTRHSYAELSRQAMSPDEEGVFARQSKLPDFLSRLKGYIDIPGVNRSVLLNDDDSNERETPYLRRAILLRSMLENRGLVSQPKKEKEKEVARVSEDIIKAFLTVSHYHHGARSIEAIIDMCTDMEGRLIKSGLPSAGQLEMHTWGAEFIARTKFSDSTWLTDFLFRPGVPVNIAFRRWRCVSNEVLSDLVVAEGQTEELLRKFLEFSESILEQIGEEDLIVFHLDNGRWIPVKLTETAILIDSMSLTNWAKDKFLNARNVAWRNHDRERLIRHLYKNLYTFLHSRKGWENSGKVELDELLGKESRESS
ncbi:MAG: hypothetical protein P1V20_28345 [Verrucomicrobiales bacterium]|nr:hypothetical protein [Verrucomicrobiales bacterium]